MKRIDKTQQDLVDVISGEIGYVQSVNYYTHLRPETKIEPPRAVYNSTLFDENGNILPWASTGKESAAREDATIKHIEVFLSSELLSTLENGELCCEIKLKTDATEYPDGEYNTIMKEGLDIWLQ